MGVTNARYLVFGTSLERDFHVYRSASSHQTKLALESQNITQLSHSVF